MLALYDEINKAAEIVEHDLVILHVESTAPGKPTRTNDVMSERSGGGIGARGGR